MCTNASDVFDDGYEPIWDVLLLEAKYVEGERTYLLEKHNVRFEYFDGEWGISIIDTENYNTVPIYISNRIEDLKRLGDIFIPNTVIKATPQSLSTAEKNQALTNLGIDPIVWKYICNPFIIPATIEEPLYIPSDLLEVIRKNPTLVSKTILYDFDGYHVPTYYGIDGDWMTFYEGGSQYMVYLDLSTGEIQISD